MSKRTILYFLIVFLVIIVSVPLLAANEGEKDHYARGKVVARLQTIPDPTEEYPFPGEILQLEITSGPFAGQVVETYNSFSGNPWYDLRVEPAQKVILQLDLDDNGQLLNAYLADVARDLPVFIFILLFTVILLFLGGKKGVRSLIGLALTITAIFTVLLPLILRGWNPMLVTILLSAIVTAVTLLLVGGWSRKTFAATLGVIGGATFAGILAYVFGKAALLTGLSSHEAQALGFIHSYKLDVQGILFASMLIGALGAVMDVGISIASAIEEVYAANPIAGPVELFRAGMNVGRDIMGTMSNTLILAYTGGSLPLLLILVGFRPSFLKTMNMDLIAGEIIRALAGSVGMFITIPLTAAFSTWLINRAIMKKYYY